MKNVLQISSTIYWKISNLSLYPPKYMAEMCDDTF